VDLLALQAVPAANLDEEKLFHMSLALVWSFSEIDG
jgi:hypothetical protein